MESFFRPRAAAGAELNPSGTHVGFRIYDVKHDAYGLIFLSLANGTATGSHGDSTYSISSFNWIGDGEVVLAMTRDAHFAQGLYAMSRDDPKNFVTLDEHDVVDVLGVPRNRPDNLLVWVRQATREGSGTGLFELNLRKNSRNGFGDLGKNIVSTVPPPGGVEGVLRWWRDRDGEIRYALAYLAGEEKLFRREADGSWALVPIELERDTPLAADPDPDTMLVAHLNDKGQRELRPRNTRDGTLGPVLHTDEKYDFSGGTVRFSADGREPIGLAYARQAPEQVWFRDKDASLQQSINAFLPADHINQITSRSRDGQRMLITSSSDRHPGTLYLYDRPTGKISKLAELAPWLPERLMAPVRLVTFAARDGLQLDGYVTLPLNYRESHPGPMIVLPHGGPWVRDSWGYDPVSQFFASRGYIVFRPNYRGSAGYSVEISKQPQFEFRRMHDDVTDGVRALIAAKIADPAHLAIVGASFGGYLALCGAAYEPGLYRCAVTIAGVFDWETMMKEDQENENNYRYAWLRRNIGDPKQQRARFEAMSPLNSVGQIKAPVFVVHGLEDTNVDADQSRHLVKALKHAGVPCEALFVPDEAHGFAELKHRVEVYTRIEAFLQKNL